MGCLMAFKIEGSLLNIDDKSKWIGVIGSREASKEELNSAYNLGILLAKRGYMVVSGLAKGIDTAAHKGALQGGGNAVAIVNTPKDQAIYPSENIVLGKMIKNSGCIIYPYSTRANETKEKGLTHFSKRLLERDILLAHWCPKIITVKHDVGKITGGTKWATTYGMKFGKEVWRFDCDGKYHKNPETDACKIWWDIELDIEGLKLN